MGLAIRARIPKGSAIIRRLDNVKNVGIDELEHALTEILEESIEVLQKYPPETAGNQPTPPWNTYYKRNVGMFRYGILRPDRRSAQDLKGHWEYSVRSSGDGVTGILENPAANPGHRDYAGYVHGSPDNDPPQTSFHSDHQWPIAKDVIAERAEADAPIMQRMLRNIKSIFDRG